MENKIKLLIELPMKAYDHIMESTQDSYDEAEAIYAIQMGTEIPERVYDLPEYEETLKKNNYVLETNKYTHTVELVPSEKKRSYEFIENVIEYMMDNYNPDEEEDCTDSQIQIRNTLRWVYAMFGHPQIIEFKNDKEEDKAND